MATQQFKHWFEYFPSNFVWSQQMMSMIDMAAWGAAAMGEIDQLGQRLKGSFREKMIRSRPATGLYVNA